MNIPFFLAEAYANFDQIGSIRCCMILKLLAKIRKFSLDVVIFCYEKLVTLSKKI